MIISKHYFLYWLIGCTVLIPLLATSLYEDDSSEKITFEVREAYFKKTRGNKNLPMIRKLKAKEPLESFSEKATHAYFLLKKTMLTYL